MLKDMKLMALRVMQETGFSSALSTSRWRNGRLLIIGYHGLSQSDEHDWNPELYVTPQRFRAQLESIRQQGFTVLGLAEGLMRLYSGRLPEQALSLTFDDGNVDFYREAMPIIREFGYPVTLYLTTYYCLDNRPVFPPALAYLLWKGRGKTLAYPARLRTGDLMHLETAEGREEARRRVWAFAEQRRATADEKHLLLSEVAALVGYDFDEMMARRLLHLMNPDEVASAARAGIDVQMHGHRHRRPLDRALYRREISENRAVIERITGRRPEHYCYPVGETHAQFLEWLAEEGVTSATTCYPAMAGPRTAPLMLPRFISDSRVSMLEFSAWLSGAAALLLRRRHVPGQLDLVAMESRPA
jgi:peptidoglycan/xylan/chitin deacetylase (PgdA/CDA1 family)